MEQPTSLLEYALAVIRENILTGKYEAGKKLSTQDIAEELGISRTPVNAAINRLVAEGLAEAIPRRGTIVRQLSKKQIKDIIEVRMLLETYAVKKAVENVLKNPDKPKYMKDILHKFDEINDDDYRMASSIESDFHRALVELSDNEQLLRLYDTNWSVGSAFYLYTMAKMPSSKQRKLFDEHKTIVRLLEEENKEELENVIKSHISAVKDVLDYI